MSPDVLWCSLLGLVISHLVVAHVAQVVVVAMLLTPHIVVAAVEHEAALVALAISWAAADVLAAVLAHNLVFIPEPPPPSSKRLYQRQHLLSIPSPLVKFQKQWLRQCAVSIKNAGPCAVKGCDAQEA
jgi:hypothetical protein